LRAGLFDHQRPVRIGHGGDDPNTPNAEGGDGSDIGAYEADPNLRITAIENATTFACASTPS
jgi:hypothetical protein